MADRRWGTGKLGDGRPAMPRIWPHWAVELGAPVVGARRMGEGFGVEALDLVAFEWAAPGIGDRNGQTRRLIGPIGARAARALRQ